MTCGAHISKTLLPIFFTDFGIQSWCKYVPFMMPEEESFTQQEVLSSPGLTFLVHVLIFCASFIIGYSWKPIIASKNFDIFKNQVMDLITKMESL